MFHRKLLRPVVPSALLCVAAVLFFTPGAGAAVTDLDHYRMGENDAGPFPGAVSSTKEKSSTRVLTATGSPLYQPDASPAASPGSTRSISFDGSSGVSATGVLTTLRDNFGVEAWIKPAGTAGAGCIAYNGDTGGSGWGLYQFGDSVQGFYGGIATFGNGTVIPNKWMHVALVRSGGVATLYVNGVASGTHTGTPHQPSGKFSVGVKPALNGEFFSGQVDEVRLFTFTAGSFTTGDLLAKPPDLNIESPPGSYFETVAVWGYNASALIPPASASLTKVKSMAAGGSHNVALLNDGTVFAWGGSDASIITIPVAAQSGVVAVAAGHHHAAALRSDGGVVAWGQNDQGQTSVPPAAQSGVTAIAASGDHTLALKSDGSVIGWGNNSSGALSMPPAAQSGVTAISASPYISAALKTNGAVVVWGNSFGNTTSIPAEAQSGVLAIATGAFHVLALQPGGRVIAWGYNGDGSTSVPPAAQAGVVAIAAGWNHSVALKSDGTVLAWGYNEDGETTVPAGLTDVRAISAGSWHTVALRDAKAPFGGVTLGTSAMRTFRVGNSGGFALNLQNVSLTGGSASDFILNTSGMLTTLSPPELAQDSTTFTVTFKPGTTGPKATTLRIASNDPNENPYDIGLTGIGQAPEIAVFTGTGTGAGDERTSGDGTHVFPNTATGGSTEQTFTVKNSGDASLSGLTLVVTGRQSGDFIAGPLATAALAPDETTTFTVKFQPRGGGARSATVEIESNDADENPFEIKVSGTGLAPQIVMEQPADTPLSTGTVTGWGMNNWGQRTPPAGLSGVKSIAAGEYHTVALKHDGTMVGWGSDTYNEVAGPMSTTEVKALAAGSSFTVLLKQNGKVVAWGNDSFSRTNVPPGLSDVHAIAAGNVHTLALKNDGTLVAWGFNSMGQASIPAGLSGVIAVAAGGYHSVALKADATLTAWGGNDYGQTNVPAGLPPVVAIAAGFRHTVALTGAGTVVAWGDDSQGQSTVPAGLSGVMAIAAGQSHTMALKKDGTVVAWGSNGYGQVTVPVGLTGIRSIACGGNHSLAVIGPAVDFGGTAPPFITVKNFTVKNSGTAPLIIGDIRVIEGNFADFSVNTAGMFNAVPGAGDASVFAVTFTPYGPGVRTATLRVQSSDPDESPLDILLTGHAAGTPEISVELPPGPPLATGSSVTFGSLQTGTPGATKMFVLKNTGTQYLNVGSVSVTGGDASDFTVNTDGMSAGVPWLGGQTRFWVTFAPASTGVKTTTLRVVSDDADENPFDITLTGTGTNFTPLELWRRQHFGSPDNTGDGADLFDFDSDGLANLVEYAFGLHPRFPNNTLSPLGQLPEAQFSGGAYTYSFSTPQGVAGISYRAEWTTLLQSGDWHAVPDTGSGGSHLFTIPAAGRDRLYVRLAVTSP